MVMVALYQPEIPPNTGNVIRLCANSGTPLHLVRPLGFELDDRRLRRAGLDYREWAQIRVHDSFEGMIAELPYDRLLAITTKGNTNHDRILYRPRDLLLFGPESRGLPAALLDRIPPDQWVRIPMQPGSRSLNLSNAVAILVYEAWRQSGFDGGD